MSFGMSHRFPVESAGRTRSACLSAWLAAILGATLPLAACTQPDPPTSEVPDAASVTSSPTALLSKLVGLWSGSGRQTPLGDFPLMNMDLRPVGAYTLFGRSDLDADNNLRFALDVESSGARELLVFRNGGYFQSILRDTRAGLIEHSEASYRFCALSGGCNYLDARWTFSAADRVELDVKVRGKQHLLWAAQRSEDRVAPQPFPADSQAHASDHDPFLPMPSLRVRVDWTDPLPAPADVWVLISRDGCSLSGCKTSRSLLALAATNDKSAELVFNQIHAGRYQVMALLDRDRSFRSTVSPSRGDGVTWPLNAAVEIAPTGETQADLHIGFTVP